MSRKEGKDKKKEKKFWRRILIIFIFVYLFFRTVPSLFAMAFKVVLPESTTIEEKIEAEAIVIKKETLYKAEGNGNIKIVYNEGDRVAKGTEICKIQLTTENSTLEQEAKELDKKIETLKSVEKEKDIIKSDEEKIEGNIINIINNIQEKINEREYGEVEILREKLALYYGKQNDLTGENYLINQSIESLEEKREALNKQLTDNTFNYYAKEAGIISYKIDGYEEIYTFHSKDNFSYSDFKSGNTKPIDIENEDKVNASDPIFKIIDNFEWYIILKIENIKDVNSYQEGDSILISSKEINEEFKGNIIQINKEGSKGTILCKFNTGFHKIYDKRFLNLDIIKYKHNGFKIPKKSVVEKDGVKGVYTKDISGIIKFKPIEILKEEEKYVYVSSGDNNNNIVIKKENNPVKTITILDEILLNTKTIKEGMIIN